MKIYEYGSRELRTLMLIHGFQCPYQMWEPYIERFSREFHVLVPVLPGHNPEDPEEFKSFEENAEELETFCLEIGKQEIYAVYGISMGGVQAAILWQRGILKIRKLIMESSPLYPFGKAMTALMSKLNADKTHQAQKRQKNALKGAEKMMGTKNYPYFLQVLDHMSDATMETYMEQVFSYDLPQGCTTEEMEIFYFYGGSPAEIVFQKAAKRLQQDYPKAVTRCFPGKGHCEDIIKNPEKRFADLCELLQNCEDKKL